MNPVRVLVFALLLLVATPLSLWAQREKLSPEDLEFVQKKWPDAKKTGTGLRYVVVKEGTGDLAKPGDLVSVLYRGSLLDGKVFDSAQDPAMPFTFRLGRNQVIQGWDQGLVGMQVGGQRRLVIPAELGYGSRGAGGVIPPNATLVFDIELLGIR